MPGVQMPHWAAPWARKDFCRPPSVPSAPARPSTVSTVRPPTWPIATRQAQTCRPSSRTVQAPQSPASQPTLVPVRPRSSRSAAASRVTGAPSHSAPRAVQGEGDLHGAKPREQAAQQGDDGVAPIGRAAAHVVDRRERREMRGVDALAQAPVERRARKRGFERGRRCATAEQAPTATRASATRPSSISSVAAAMAIEITR